MANTIERAAVTLRVRTDRLEHYRSSLGIATPAALAKFMGMAPSSVTRVIAGEYEPGPRFIASLLTVFPTLRFRDLFEITEVADGDTDQKAGAA